MFMSILGESVYFKKSLVPYYRSGLVQGNIFANGDYSSAYFTDNDPYSEDGQYLADKSTTGDERPEQTGRCYKFDGINDFIDYGDQPEFNITDDLTISIWFKAPTRSGGRGLVSKYSATNGQRGYGLQFDNGQLAFYYQRSLTPFNIDDSLKMSTRSDDNTWHHVACVFSASNYAKMYVDNVLVAEDTVNIPSSIISNSQPLLLGKLDNNLFDGYLFDVRIYNRVITSQEVNDLYNFKYIPDVVLQDKCDNSDSPTSYDSSGSGNHGIKTNITPSTFHYEGSDVPYSYQNKVGYAEYILFNGSTNYVNIDSLASNLNSSNNIRLVTNFVTGKNTGLNYENMLFSGHTSTNGNLIRVGVSTTTGGILVVDGSVNATFGAGFNDNRPHKIDITIEDGETPILLVDGITIATTGDSSLDLSSLTKVSIGQEYDPSNLSDFFEGIIYDVNVYSDNTLISKYAGRGNDAWKDLISENNGLFIGALENSLAPRDESNITQDVLGNPLQYSGRVPRNAKLIESNCATFDGVNDYIETNLDTSFIQNTLKFELDFYVIVKDLGVRQSFCGSAIGSNEKGFFLLFENGVGAGTRALRFNVTKGQSGNSVFGITTVDNVINDNLPHHVKIVGTGSSVEFYIDGVRASTSINSSLTSFSTGASTRTLNIGRTPHASATYNTSATLFNFKVKDNNDNTVLNYPMSEGVGVTIFDVSGDDNHGTAVNTSASTFWGASQDCFHYNLTKGFKQLAFFKIPALADGSAAADGGVITNPADGFNDAETKINFAPVASPQSVKHYSGYAEFDGSSHISLNSQLGIVSSNSVQPFTISAWVYPTASGQMRIVGDTAAGGFLLTRAGIPTDKLYLGFYDGGTSNRRAVASADTLPINTWSHIIATHDGTETEAGMKLYINNVEQAKSSESGGAYSSITSASLDIGKWSNGSYATGRIKNLSLINRVITEAERNTIYSNGTVSQDVSGIYELKKDSLDSSGNDNHGDNNGVTFATITLPTDYAFGDTLPEGMTKEVESSVKEHKFLIETS